MPTNEVLVLSVAKPMAEGNPSLVIHSVLHIDRSDQEVLTPAGTVADLSATDLSQYSVDQVTVLTLICANDQ